MASLLDYAKFANDAYEIESKLNIKGFSKLLEIDYDNSDGFQGSAYYNPTTKELVVAYAGTDFSTIEDWKTNGGIAIGRTVDQVVEAEKFLDKAFNALVSEGFDASEIKLTVTGHSLGGYLAQNIMIDINNPEQNQEPRFGYINKDNVNGIVFDAPGVIGGYKFDNLYSISDGNDFVTGLGFGDVLTDNQITIGNTLGPSAHKMTVLIDTLEKNSFVGNRTIEEINGLSNEAKSVLFTDAEDLVVYMKENEPQNYETMAKNDPSTNTQYLNQIAQNAIDNFNSGANPNLDYLVDAISKSPKAIDDLREILDQKGNDDLLEHLKDTESFNKAPEDLKKLIALEANEEHSISTQLGSTVGGSIGSIIIGNNNFSNIENIMIDTGMTTIGQNVGEYLGGKSVFASLESLLFWNINEY